MIPKDLKRKCLRKGGIIDNQEDSLIFNKYQVSVQKNQLTSQDDIFMNPDPSKVANMKSGNYTKLNDKGYVPEETKLENNDIIFGKVTPIPDAGPDSKPYRDSSESFKMNATGVVDKMYIDIQNQDGYLTREASIRSERIPRIGDKYACYDDQTEILTTDGWIYFKDLTKNHYVATLVDNKLEYQQPLMTHSYDYNGKMYSVKSNHVDLVVTPNHGMWVKLRGNKGYRRIVYIPKNINNKYVKNNTYFVLPAHENNKERLLDLKTFVEFFGIWIAEGWANHHTSFAAHKPRVKDALIRLCRILNLEISTCFDNKNAGEKNIWYIVDKQLNEYMKPFSVGATNKKLPEWVWSLTRENCRILINGMMLGDGHSMKGTTTRRYDTSSHELADDFQRLCLHAGYACNITKKHDAGMTSTIKTGYNKGCVITATVDGYRMSVIETQTEPKVNKNKKRNLKQNDNDKSEWINTQDKWIDYKGKVYCCSVVGSKSAKLTINGVDLDVGGVLYVRRNKIPVWSGNSRMG